MFDVNQAVHRYSVSVSTSWIRRAAQIAELEDHLHCEIESLVASGITAEEAFAKATSQFGESNALQREFRKNRWRLSISCVTRVFGRYRLEQSVGIGIVRSRLALTSFALLTMIPAVMFLQQAAVARWTLNVFEACCSATVKVIGLFG